MRAATAQSRLIMMKSLEAQPDLTVILDSSGSPGSRLQARFIGHTGDVMKIQTKVALGPNMIVSVAGQVDTGTGASPLLGQYRVCWSRIVGVGKYHAELAIQTPTESDDEDAAPAAEAAPGSAPLGLEDPDYYEILQLSRQADTETIHRVFHVLAQRYHPDNRETGDNRMFCKLVEAHGVLTHAERRAAYDVSLIANDKVRLKIFDSLASTQGVQAEIRKRKGILKLLYTKRLTDPYQPAIRLREFAEMLGCPVEHLEFSLWFLRERKLIARAENNANQYEITSSGAEAFEAEESNYTKKSPLTLPAAAQASA